MTDLVPEDEIEGIVGVFRHDAHHFGRADSARETVFILHSEQCRASTPDLRDCPFSVALDRGIRHPIPWSWWSAVQDRPVRLELDTGYLMPKLALTEGPERD